MPPERSKTPWTKTQAPMKIANVRRLTLGQARNAIPTRISATPTPTFHPRPELSTGGVAARNAPLTTKKIDTTAARSASVHWTDKLTIPPTALTIQASSRTHHCLLTDSAAGRSIATRVTGLNMGVPSGPPLRRARLRVRALLTRTVSTVSYKPLQVPTNHTG